MECPNCGLALISKDRLKHYYTAYYRREDSGTIVKINRKRKGRERTIVAKPFDDDIIRNIWKELIPNYFLVTKGAFEESIFLAKKIQAKWKKGFYQSKKFVSSWE